VDRVLTRKGAVVELAIVTAGVLIALSFDGARPPRAAIDAWIEVISRLDSQIYLLDKFAENLTTGYGRVLAETAK
jgi:hypothetical protein